MNEQLFERMATIVEGTGAQRDFEKYDRKFIEDYGLPMLWTVREGGTNLTALGKFEEWFYENESERYDYVRNGFSSYTYYIDNWSDGARTYLLTEDDVREVTPKVAHEIVRDLFTPVVERWKAENGPLPKNEKMTVKFFNVTLSKVKELIRECEAHNDTSLIDILRRFHSWGRTAKDQYVQVSYNPYYNEFIFCQYTNGEQGIVGGIVFHGWPETGYQENFSVQLTPSYGWSSHT